MSLRAVMLAAAAVAAVVLTTAVGATERPLVCYWEGWSVYRQDPYKGNSSSLPIDKCNHIIYAFLGLDDATNTVKYLDKWQDVDNGGLARFVKQRASRPDLKVSFAIGGWNEGSSSYSAMASTARGRATFAASIAGLIKDYGFDGVDLDWEYPGSRGGSPQVDKENFVKLLQAIRKAIGNKKLLTIAVWANINSLDVTYDVPAISKLVDYIHVMTYDLRGPWDRNVDNHVLLRARSSDKSELAHLTVVDAMSAWESRGAPRSKLLMGIAFYGRSFTLTDATKHIIGSPAQGPGRAGPFSQTEGSMFYFEICKLLKDQDWRRKWDDEEEVPYIYKDNQWIGYEDVKGIKRKVNYLKKAGYGGVMVWAVGNDDMANVCGDGEYPLLTALSQHLNGDDSGETTVAPPATPTAVTSEAPLTESSDPTTVAPTSDGPTSTNCPLPSTDVPSTRELPASTTMSPVWPPRCRAPTLPHEVSCRKFYLCDDSGLIRHIEMNCPDSLVFNEDIGVCDWNYNTHPAPANCSDFCN